MKHNHKVLMAFAAGWIVAAFLPPTTVLGMFKSKTQA